MGCIQRAEEEEIDMGKKSIYWKKLTERHKVKLVGKYGERHWETGSGRLITFGSRERKEAQRHLHFMANLKKRKRR